MKIYPLISDYKIAIEMSESFATRTTLVPYKVNGALSFASGGQAVVFKMQDSATNNYYALKCFVKHQQNREHNFSHIDTYIRSLGNNPYFVTYDYLPEELWVKDADFPVLIMPWIEGKTMSLLISELCAAEDLDSLSQLACKFDKMALWLLSQDMAHGDLKPDNIIVTPSGDLKLIDYDGMYVPSLAGSSSLELGTAEYRHPKRSSGDFNVLLDDFPILVLSLSLHALSIKPSLYNPSQGADTLLIRSEDYKNLLGAPCSSFFSTNADNAVIYARFSMLVYSVTQPIIKLEGLCGLLKETASQADILIASVLGNDGEWIDEFGVKYSADGLKLIKCTDEVSHYKVKEGCCVICDWAFSDCYNITNLIFPSSVTTIGEGAFRDCSNLSSLTLPSSLTTIGNYVFWHCSSLTSLTLSLSLMAIGEGAFGNCCSLTSLTLPSSLTTIGKGAFSRCSSLTSMTLPSSVTTIENCTFFCCSNLTSLILPSSLTTIGNYAFWHCISLISLTFPSSVKTIRRGAFKGCSNLATTYIPKESRLSELLKCHVDPNIIKAV